MTARSVQQVALARGAGSLGQTPQRALRTESVTQSGPSAEARRSDRLLPMRNFPLLAFVHDIARDRACFSGSQILES